MKNEYNLSKLKKRQNIKTSKDLKISKTIRLDVDALLWLQDKADEEGMGYQTFLNSFLKKSMKRLIKLENKVKKGQVFLINLIPLQYQIISA